MQESESPGGLRRQHPRASRPLRQNEAGRPVPPGRPASFGSTAESCCPRTAERAGAAPGTSGFRHSCQGNYGHIRRAAGYARRTGCRFRPPYLGKNFGGFRVFKICPAPRPAACQRPPCTRPPTRRPAAPAQSGRCCPTAPRSFPHWSPAHRPPPRSGC